MGAHIFTRGILQKLRFDLRMYEDYTFRPVRKNYNQTNFKALAALVCIVIIIPLILIIIHRQKTSSVTSPLAKNQSTQTPTKQRKSTGSGFSILGIFKRAEKPAETEQELLTIIKKRMEKEKGFYSVYIFNIGNNEGLGINETTILTAASVNKVPILATLYFLAQKGTIDLDTRITLQAGDIQDFGTGVLRYETPGAVYSLKSIAQLLIQKSDNTAGFILGDEIIGLDTIQETMEGWGLQQTDMVQNKTSNKDMALLLTKIYKGQVTNSAYTQEMLGFMKDTDFENRLPRHIPKTVPVYHKIGNEVGIVHDVGIVALPKNPYYIGVMTNDIIDVEHTEDVIADISKLVFDFYQKME